MLGTAAAADGHPTVDRRNSAQSSAVLICFCCVHARAVPQPQRWLCTGQRSTLAFSMEDPPVAGPSAPSEAGSDDASSRASATSSSQSTGNNGTGVFIPVSSVPSQEGTLDTGWLARGADWGGGKVHGTGVRPQTARLANVLQEQQCSCLLACANARGSCVSCSLATHTH